MKIPVFTSQFKKDYKLSQKRGKDISKIKAVMSELTNEKSLSSSNKDHSLSGNYKNCRECHIETDWLLIYEVTKTEIHFLRTGSHSDLFR